MTSACTHYCADEDADVASLAFFKSSLKYRYLPSTRNLASVKYSWNVRGLLSDEGSGVRPVLSSATSTLYMYYISAHAILALINKGTRPNIPCCRATTYYALDASFKMFSTSYHLFMRHSRFYGSDSGHKTVYITWGSCNLCEISWRVEIPDAQERRLGWWVSGRGGGMARRSLQE